jgi:solute carrier family 25 (mitochondrial iron transporter), member 28/37
MVAGAAAGIAEHVAMFPVDTVKTRAQALAHPGQRLRGGPVAAAVASILRREGLRGLYGGVTAVAVGAGPAHALYFAVYEWVKAGLGPGGWGGGGGSGSGGSGDSTTPPPLAHPTLAAAAAGAAATIVSDGVMTPCDVVKQRLQVVGSPYAGVGDCVSRTLAAEGPGAFFKSLRTTLVTNIPFTALHFGTYEAAKGAAADVRGAWLAWRRGGEGGGGEGRGGGGGGGGSGGDASPSSSSPLSPPRDLPWWWDLVGDEEGLVTQLTAGGAAGGVAAAATTPLDVAKTRLQLEGVTAAARYDGRGAVLPTLARIAREEGPAALWAGLRPRVLFHVPAAAICWGTYETAKAALVGGKGGE